MSKTINIGNHIGIGALNGRVYRIKPQGCH